MFQDGDLELLEDYDEAIAFYEVFETSDGSDDLKSSSVSTMCMNLSFSSEKRQSDAVADGVEVKRLRGMCADRYECKQ